jgi:signal transduction histidine kinase
MGMTQQLKAGGLFGTWRRLFFAAAVAFFGLAGFSAWAETATADVLTNAADVLSLTADQARQRVPVLVRGIVTAAEPGWDGEFFVQDATSGVFVEGRSTLAPEVGDLVEVSGFTTRGAFAPTISREFWKKLGTAPLPAAKHVSVERLMSGLEDGQRVEISGIVRAVKPEQPNMDVEIASAGFRFHVFPRRPADVQPLDLIGATVRVRGTAAVSWNSVTRQLVAVVIFVPQTNDFIVDQMEPGNPFAKPIIPAGSVAQYRRDAVPGDRVHVKGVVTLQRPGQDFFLKADNGGLHVQSHQAGKLAAGDIVEAVGFPGVDQFEPVLSDAIFRKTNEKQAPADAKSVELDEIMRDGLHHADFIAMTGKLLERSSRRSQTGADASIVTLLLQKAEGQVFMAEGEIPNWDASLDSIPVGSTVKVNGICLLQRGEEAPQGAVRPVAGFHMLIPDSSSVQILKQPSWFTPKRLLIGVGLLFIVLMMAVSWSVMVSKKNSALRELIRVREETQRDLQEAHDQLEERVKERTAQLKFQITARKESEVQFKATLKERTRLAQELHDTLEQTLTGIALQLDTSSKLFESKPENANHHLEMARSLVAQSQVDVRRSVWDLRSRALEQFNLPGALSTSVRQLVDGTKINLKVSSKGRVRPLSETVEENLLRIAQEALTNVIKHSEATEVTIELDYGPQNIVLEVRDNGRGFEQDKSAGPGQGHFGLLGISERAKRLGGELAVSSEPGRGTTVRVQVPIGNDSPAPNFSASEAIA